MTLETGEFLRRFCLHLLPERWVKIRHYGLLANRQRRERIAQARALLHVIPTQSELPNSEKSENAPLLVCPHCGSKRVMLIEVVKFGRANQPVFLNSS